MAGGALRTPESRALSLVAAFSVPPAIVVGALAVVVGGVIAGVVGLVVVLAALAAWARFGGDRIVARGLGGRDAEPDVDARLFNVVEGLAVNAGVPQPRVRVLKSDGLNVAAAGTSPQRGLLVVTTGLLTELSLVELEAVIAVEVMQVRRRETYPLTVLAATFGVLGGVATAFDHDAEADLAGVSLTRYPPALESALEKIESKGSTVAGQTARTRRLWLVDPVDPATAKGRIPIGERVEAIREL